MSIRSDELCTRLESEKVMCADLRLGRFRTAAK